MENVTVPVDTQYDNLPLKTQATMHVKDAEMHMLAAIPLYERAAEAEGDIDCKIYANILRLCIGTIRMDIPTTIKPVTTEKNEADDTV